MTKAVYIIITCIYARVKCVYMIVKFIIINTRTQLIDYIHTGMVVELEASRSVVGELFFVEPPLCILGESVWLL